MDHRAWRKTRTGSRTALRAGLLQYDGSVHRAGTAQTAARGASVRGEGSAVDARVVIGNWAPFQKLVVHQLIAPGSFFPYAGWTLRSASESTSFRAIPANRWRSFSCGRRAARDTPQCDQHRLGRAELYGMPFATFERNVRTLLGNASVQPGLTRHAIFWRST